MKNQSLQYRGTKDRSKKNVAEELTDEVRSFKLLTKMNQNTDMEEFLSDCIILCAKLKKWNLDEAKLVEEGYS